MSESPTPYEGVDELSRWHREAGGESVVRIDVNGDVKPTDEWVIVGVDALEELKAEKETAERAFLKTWCAYYEDFATQCRVCLGVRRGDEVEHTPDCIIPGLIKRYGEG